MSNTNGSGIGQATYHDNPDNAIRFAAPGAGTSRLSQMVALADIWRVYEAHVVHYPPGLAIHNSFDSVNVPADLPPLMNIHRLFIEGLESATVTAPETDNPGAAYLAQLGGCVLP
jgi:hypothetical protein